LLSANLQWRSGCNRLPVPKRLYSNYLYSDWPSVPAGTYTLSGELTGFSCTFTFDPSSIIVVTGQTATVSFTAECSPKSLLKTPLQKKDIGRKWD
jgi:hypothetical protein